MQFNDVPVEGWWEERVGASNDGKKFLIGVVTADRNSAWIDSLDPVDDDIQFTWDTFVQEFTEHFMDSQDQQ